MAQRRKIDSGIVTFIAPYHLVSEIDQEHLARILPAGKSIADAQREWNDLRTKIRFYQPMSNGDESLHEIDPDDVAYALTCEETGAHAIHSRDKHLREMGARVVSDTPRPDSARLCPIECSRHGDRGQFRRCHNGQLRVYSNYMGTDRESIRRLLFA